ncbi:uncharacterized protein [Typha latifolia]|uniref:uncharacterized protein isoform X2 n=1 Tax=Typha latifolia TaxID=4733 RepID=UPI003C2ECA9E
MGCFLACFGGPKHPKRRRSPKRSPPRVRMHESYKLLQQSASPRLPSQKQITAQLSPKKLSPKKLLEEVAVGQTLVPELRESNEQGSNEQGSNSCKKKVTFDLNVKTYEPVLADDEEYLSEGNEEDEATKEDEMQEEQEEVGKSTPKSGAYPSNYRYQNCQNCESDESDYGEDEEEDEEDYDDDDCGINEEDDIVGIEGNDDESYESFFSLPMDRERENNQEVCSPAPKGASSPDRHPILLTKGNPRDRSHYVHSVLNPVENLSQWKEVKVRTVPQKNPSKENVNLEQVNNMILSSEPTFKTKKPEKPAVSNHSPSLSKQEVSVDASLSTWLASSGNSSVKRTQESNSFHSSSPISREERPILGALTVDDIKQSSATSSPRKSPSRSPDEIPIVGTVGSYWNCRSQRNESSYSSRSGSETKGIPNTTSKYSEDKRVNWHSTPFEVRLERALNGTAV